MHLTPAEPKRLRRSTGPLLPPKSKSSEEVEKENDAGNHGCLNTKRKNAGRHAGLQVDIDCHGHLRDEEQTRDQEEGLSGLCGERSSQPWKQEEDACNHFRHFARKNRLVG